MKKLNIRQLFLEPKAFAKYLLKEEKIRWDVWGVVILLVLIYRGWLLHDINQNAILRPIVSVIIFAGVQFWIYRLARGTVSFKTIINMSIYFHLIVVVGSFEKQIPVISIIIFLGSQVLGIFYQYYIGTEMIGANRKFIKIFCMIELVSALMSVNYQLLTYLGRCVIYNERTQYFGLIVK